MAQVEQFIEEVSKYSSVLLDTNSVIYFLDGTPGFINLLEPFFEIVEQCQVKVNLSVITEAELLIKPYREKNLEAIKAVELLTSDFPNIEVVPVSREIARKAACIRSDSGLKLPDAIIVSTAINSNSEAIIGNDIELLKKSVSYLPAVILSQYISFQ